MRGTQENRGLTSFSGFSAAFSFPQDYSLGKERFGLQTSAQKESDLQQC